jgi:hypothetical protein
MPTRILSSVAFSIRNIFIDREEEQDGCPYFSVSGQRLALIVHLQRLLITFPYVFHAKSYLSPRRAADRRSIVCGRGFLAFCAGAGASLRFS